MDRLVWGIVFVGVVDDACGRVYPTILKGNMGIVGVLILIPKRLLHFRPEV